MSIYLNSNNVLAVLIKIFIRVTNKKIKNEKYLIIEEGWVL